MLMSKTISCNTLKIRFFCDGDYCCKSCKHFNVHADTVKRCLQMLKSLFRCDDAPVFVSFPQSYQTSPHLVTALLRFRKCVPLCYKDKLVKRYLNLELGSFL